MSEILQVSSAELGEAGGFNPLIVRQAALKRRLQDTAMLPIGRLVAAQTAAISGDS
jgi:hypothetical protein